MMCRSSAANYGQPECKGIISSPTSVIKFPAVNRTDLPIAALETSMCRRVHFCEQDNTEYKSPHDRDDMDWSTLWYNQADFEKFKQSRCKYARFLLRKERKDKNPIAWFDLLRQEYQDYSDAKNSDAVANVLARITCPRQFQPEFIGMNVLMIPMFWKDRVQRRERLYQAVRYWQDCPHLDNTRRAEKIRRVSCSISQSSRLFANHTAWLCLVACCSSD